MTEKKYNAPENNNFLTILQYNNFRKQFNESLAKKQDKVDNSLATANKEIVEAINELKATTDQQAQTITSIEANK